MSLFNQNGKIINYFSYITTADKSLGQEYLSQLKRCAVGIIGYLVFFAIAIILLLNLSAIAGHNFNIADQKFIAKTMANKNIDVAINDMSIAGKDSLLNYYIYNFKCCQVNNSSQNGSYFSWFKIIFFEAIIVIPTFLYCYKIIKTRYADLSHLLNKYYGLIAVVSVISIVGYYFIFVYLEFPVSQLYVLDKAAASYIDNI